MRRFLAKLGIGPAVGVLLFALFFFARARRARCSRRTAPKRRTSVTCSRSRATRTCSAPTRTAATAVAALCGARASPPASRSSVVALCLVIGIAVGTIAGYFGGAVDEVIMRVVDVLLAFPGILLNLAIVAIVPSAGVGVFVFALTINGWVGYARVARGQVLQVREREFVQARARDRRVAVAHHGCVTSSPTRCRR